MNERIAATYPFLKGINKPKEIIKAIINPTSGAININEDENIWVIDRVNSTKSCSLQQPAPANPPINVCDDEEGMPNHQVNKFQIIAAIKPEKTTFIIIITFIPFLAEQFLQLY